MPLFQSLTSWFNPNSSSSSNGSSSRHQARRSVMNSTIDAFSLPTTSGARYPEPSMMHDDSASSSPGPSRRNSGGNFTAYPPQADSYNSSSKAYPPLSHTFHRLRNALADSFPELLETLNPPAEAPLILAFERELGCPLPPSVRDTFRIADGQDLESVNNLPNGGLCYGLYLLPLDEVMREWAFWRQAEYDPNSGQNAAVLATMASIPPKWIKSLYACRGWIPLLSDRSGNYVGVDLDPGEGGSWGQVIVFGRDFDRKCVLWKGDGEGGWGKWFAAFVDELESGEGWEADRSNSSDEEEQLGYGSYTGGNSYGEGGSGLRLAGEYRGWNVLEAWWDRSVRLWEDSGLGLDVEEVEKGLSEARRLAGYDEKGKGKESGMGIGMGVGVSAAQVEIPVLASPRIPHPSTPTPLDSDVLLPPTSPENLPAPPVVRLNHPAQRTITPITTSDHPLNPMKTKANRVSSQDGYLSPPTRSPPRNSRRVSQAPAPVPLDLPTRADIQALHAITQAEASGLRGGWVLHSEAPAAARLYAARNEEGMVNIDLEGGRAEKFGSPRMSDSEMQRQREEEKLAIAGLEQRRPQTPLIGTSRTPSPLSRDHSLEITPTTPHGNGGINDTTPRALYREDGGPAVVPPSVIAATSALRRPPPIANNTHTPRRRSSDEDHEREIHRITPQGTQPRQVESRRRMERESSVLSTLSTTSDQGLLDNPSRGGSGRASPVLGGSTLDSPLNMHTAKVPEVRVADLEDGMEDISLDGR